LKAAKRVQSKKVMSAMAVRSPQYGNQSRHVITLLSQSTITSIGDLFGMPSTRLWLLDPPKTLLHSPLNFARNN
jgi:uncharacterized protein with NRDE domain